MGGAAGRRHRPHHEIRSTAGQRRASILWQRCSPAARIALEYAAANRVLVCEETKWIVSIRHRSDRNQEDCKDEVQWFEAESDSLRSSLGLSLYRRKCIRANRVTKNENDH